MKQAQIASAAAALLAATAPCAFAQLQQMRPPEGDMQSQLRRVQPSLAAQEIAARCEALTQAFRPAPMVVFDWRMAERYGIDMNDNRIPDLPNTPGYVDNTDPAATGPNACPGSEDTPRFSVYFDGLLGSTGAPDSVEQAAREQYEALGCQGELDWPYNAPQWREGLAWRVVTQDGEEITARGAEARICLPEGRHRVTLDGGFEEGLPSVTRTVEVIDHYIVNLGDSYGAGEGAPERLWLPDDRDFWDDNLYREFPFLTQWADPGVELPYTRRTRGSLHPELSGSYRTLDASALRSGRDGEYAMFFAHNAAHRSSFTHASQLAMQLEAADPYSSVTFVNLAQSGARIGKGVLSPYAGVEPAGRTFNPQVIDMRSLTEARSADKVYLSVGGNDVGFANVIAVLMAAIDWDTAGDEPGGAVAQMIESFHSGRWTAGEWYEIFEGYGLADDTGGLRDGSVEMGQLPGLDGLDRAYASLEGEIGRLPSGQARHFTFEGMRQEGRLDGPITLIAPPFFGATDEDGFDRRPEIERIVRNAALDQIYCDVDAKGPGLVNLSPREFQVAETTIFNPLIAQMRRSAARLGWRFIEQGDAPASHGICGDWPYAPWRYDPRHPVDLANASGEGVRWYRNPMDGGRMQPGDELSNAGMFHPNELGYAHVRDLLLADLPFYGVEIDGVHWGDEDDSFGELSASPLLDESPQIFSLERHRDVSLRRFSADAACEPISLTTINRGVERLTITVFAWNGAALASSDPNLPVERRSNASTPATLLSGQSRTVTAVNSHGLQRSPQLELVDQCAAGLAVGERRQDRRFSRLDFVPPRAGHYLVAVSYAQNTLFDPMTGRGDVGPDAERSTEVRLGLRRGD